MKLEVIGKGLTVTSAMWEQAETKLAKIADLFADTDSLNAVVVYKVHPRTGEQSVEVTLTSRQLTVRAKSRGTDTYECLDLCIDKLTGQLRKAKTQQERSRSRGFLDDFADFDTQNEQPVDVTKVKKLDALIAEKMGFAATYPVSGQTYSRKVDYNVLSVLCSIAQSATKFSNDIRLLSNLKEVEEPFESKQIGSSAMAYKRNPMRSERMASLSRYVIVDSLNPAVTAATQWFERTLDDSANKRISVPEAFLAVDAVLSLYINVISGLKLYPKIIERNLNRELPFMATENILMYCVKEKGGDRQELHEAIRKHSVAAAAVVKKEGGENDLLDRILADPLFGLTKEELDSIMDVRQFVGCAAEQTEEFLSETVRPLLAANPYDRSAASAIRV